MAAMRDTGAGLTREELEEYQTTDPELYNKWQAIQVDFPWYMDLRTLIGNRPNSNPVGLGNSKSDVDDAVLAGGPSASDTESIIAVDEGVDLDTTQVEEETTRARPISDVLDDDDELYMRSPTPSILQADKEVTSTVGKRKTPPEMSDSEEITATNASSRKNHMGAEGTSRKGAVSPAPTPNKVTTAGGTKGTSSKKSKAETKGAKKLKFSEDFVEIAVAEEQTKQKQLELRRMEREYELEKLKLKGAAKTDGLRMKFELEKAKLQAATDIRLAKLKYANRNSTSGDTGFNAPAAGFSGHGGGPSMYMGHVGGAFHQGEAMPQVRPVGHDGWETIGSDRALNRGASPALGTQQVGLDFTHFSGAGPSSRLWDDVPEPNDGK
ncbi:hypothetical protein DAEQUDRAFT_101000 [Daedalea quercina L-15889]|uniref:Uncharacterized protein n=1 Tax=Daedalea quercina L-15889 TaxID=1314783 RepID=A0A165KW43_9APHY|nr:hypothetical protein DAEQUDRAFT_101000 [Daedalea quercina L-15889]